jgi:hypothetical protein
MHLPSPRNTDLPAPPRAMPPLAPRPNLGIAVRGVSRRKRYVVCQGSTYGRLYCTRVWPAKSTAPLPHTQPHTSSTTPPSNPQQRLPAPPRARPPLAPSPNLGIAVRGVSRRDGRVVVTLGRTGRWFNGTCSDQGHIEMEPAGCSRFAVTRHVTRQARDIQRDRHTGRRDWR